MSSEIDLGYLLALEAEERTARPDPGTTLGYPTLRKGIVTTVSPFQVDGLPAANVTHAHLPAGTVVWMLVDAGRRLVIGRAGAGRSAGGIVPGGFTSRTDIFDSAATLSGTIILSLTGVPVHAGRRYRMAAHARWSTTTNPWLLRQELRINGDSRDSNVELVDRTSAAETHRVGSEFYFGATSTTTITVELAAARVAGTFAHTQHRASSLAPTQLSVEDVGPLA